MPPALFVDVDLESIGQLRNAITPIANRAWLNRRAAAAGKTGSADQVNDGLDASMDPRVSAPATIACAIA